MTISDASGGGAEREFMNLLNAIPRAEFEIHVVLWRNQGRWVPPKGVTLEVLGKTRPWHVARVIRRLSESMRRFSPDVVFSQLHYVNTVTGTAIRTMGAEPIWVARFVNDPAFEFAPGLGIWARRSVSRATRVFAASRGAANALERYLKLAGGSVEAVDNVVDLDSVRVLAGEFNPDRGSEYRFVVAGRLTKQKNHQMLLNAFAALAGSPRLWVLGTGELEPRLKGLAKRLGIEGRVDWMGYRENPYPFIRAADCLVLSSDAEGLPNVLIEAMALGTPVISTRCRFGPDELIDHGATGLLVEPGDVLQLSEAMASVMNDAEGAHQRAKLAARVTLKRFDPEITTPRYVNAFRGTI